MKKSCFKTSLKVILYLVTFEVQHFWATRKQMNFSAYFVFPLDTITICYSIHRTFIPVVLQKIRFYFLMGLLGGGHPKTDHGRKSNVFCDMGTNDFFFLHIWKSFSLYGRRVCSNLDCHSTTYTSLFHHYCLVNIITNDTEMPTSFFLPFHHLYLSFYCSKPQ